MTQPLTSEQLSQEGQAAYKREEYLEAIKLFEAAEAGYQSSGDRLNAAEMANNRCVALLQEGEAEAALEAVGDTDQVFAEANDARRQALALGNKGAALAALGKMEEAEKMYWDSVQILKEIGDDDLRAAVMQSISRLQLQGGRPLEAVASMQSGLEGVEKPNITQRLLKKLLKVPEKFMNRR